MQNIPLKFQIRKNCIIAYNDFNYLEKSKFKEVKPRKKIVRQYTFSASAKKRMKKIIDLLDYTIENTGKEISFITLTISSKYDKQTRMEVLLKTWLEKMLYRYGKFNYVWKLELQENGNPHYHLLIDEKIDWKIVRGIWNKTQKMFVDKYQIKMKEKYKNGYYFDEKMVDKKGITITDEVQYKRYLKGKKANWRNPNSTDVKEVNLSEESIGSYINKYFTKSENEKNYNHIDMLEKMKISRFHGCNDELKMLKYATIEEKEIDEITQDEVVKNLIKTVKDENLKELCYVYEKCKTEQLINIEKQQREENIKLITYNNLAKKLLLKKEVKKYDKMFA